MKKTDFQELEKQYAKELQLRKINLNRHIRALNFVMKYLDRRRYIMWMKMIVMGYSTPVAIDKVYQAKSSEIEKWIAEHVTKPNESKEETN